MGSICTIKSILSLHPLWFLNFYILSKEIMIIQKSYFKPLLWNCLLILLILPEAPAAIRKGFLKAGSCHLKVFLKSTRFDGFS
jgi:hypothetical protein